MISKQEKWCLVIFNLLYILPFTVYYVSNNNFEFLWYVAVLLFFFGLILVTLNRSGFSRLVLWGLSIWGLLHMAGGGLKVGSNVLYALRLLPIYDGGGEFYILKFDQLVHAFGFGVATMVVYELLSPYLNRNANWKVIYPLIVAAGMGLGAFNEIVEFIAVLVFADTGVGGYLNTSLDLVFNTLGAVLAVILIHARRRALTQTSSGVLLY